MNARTGTGRKIKETNIAYNRKLWKSIIVYVLKRHGKKKKKHFCADANLQDSYNSQYFYNKSSDKHHSLFSPVQIFTARTQHTTSKI